MPGKVFKIGTFSDWVGLFEDWRKDIGVNPKEVAEWWRLAPSPAGSSRSI